jgi:quinolinate synthase
MPPVRPIDNPGPGGALAARPAGTVPVPELERNMPVIEEILELKERVGAAIVAHHHQMPLITSTVADVTGDSLALVQFALRSEAETIVVCGVRFMAETVKLLCPDKRVLLPVAAAGCTLADSIAADDVLRIRAHCPGVPVIAYVNSSAAVKAEADICCTAANAARIASSLASESVILLPDRYLADYVAREAEIEVIAWEGECECEVHARLSLAEARECRVSLHVTVRVPDSASVPCPQLSFLRPCDLCRHMQATTLETVAAALRRMQTEIRIDPPIAERARRPLERMMATA